MYLGRHTVMETVGIVELRRNRYCAEMTGRVHEYIMYVHEGGIFWYTADPERNE